MRRGVQLPELAEMAALPAADRGCGAAVIRFGMGEVMLDGPAADLSSIHAEVALTEHLAASEAVGCRGFTAEHFVQERVNLGGPVGRMIAAGGARGPGGLLMMGTRLEVVAVELIKPGASQAQFFSGGCGLDAFVAEEAQHMPDKRRSTALGQLGSFSFSSGERSKTGGRCPPDPVGFFAFCLLQQGAEESRRAVAGPPDPNLAVRKPPDRRSGRIPALPYPPLEHLKNISPQPEDKGPK